ELHVFVFSFFFFFQAEDGIRDRNVTGVQTCALPISVSTIPSSCKRSALMPEAAEAMGINAERLHELGIVDTVVPEPLGSAHRDYEATAAAIRNALISQLEHLRTLPVDELVERRYQRFMSYGNVEQHG